MTNRKNQNSILFLTTLGVYLGLVLIGATPQVLAQAATAKQFNVKDEIEVKDGLDKKPKDDRSPVTVSIQVYLDDVEYFLATLGQLTAKGKFDLQNDSFHLTQSTLLPCVDRNLAGRYTPTRFESTNEAARPVLAYVSRGMVYGYSLGDCIANSGFRGVDAVASSFDVKLESKGLTAWIEVKKDSEQSARHLKESLDRALTLYSTSPNTKLRQGIIERTRFGFRESQVIVSLHLARSDLDSLLATNAK